MVDRANMKGAALGVVEFCTNEWTAVNPPQAHDITMVFTKTKQVKNALSFLMYSKVGVTAIMNGATVSQIL